MNKITDCIEEKKLFTYLVLSTDQHWENVLPVELLKHVKVLGPCRVFGDGDDNGLLCGPHYKVTHIPASNVELTLDLVPVCVGLFQGIPLPL